MDPVEALMLDLLIGGVLEAEARTGRRQGMLALALMLARTSLEAGGVVATMRARMAADEVYDRDVARVLRALENLGS